MNLTYYHNSKCSKSREGLELLKAQGLTPIVVEYLKHPLTSKEVLALLKKLNIGPLEGVVRVKEQAYLTLAHKEEKRDLEQWAEIIAANPILLERPILADHNQAVIGRPPENLLSLKGLAKKK